MSDEPEDKFQVVVKYDRWDPTHPIVSISHTPNFWTTVQFYNLDQLRQVYDTIRTFLRIQDEVQRRWEQHAREGAEDEPS